MFSTIFPLTLSLPNLAKSKLRQNFIWEIFEKQLAPCVSTGREILFEWSRHRIWSTDSKDRVTLQNSIRHSGSETVNKTSTSLYNFNEDIDYIYT